MASSSSLITTNGGNVSLLGYGGGTGPSELNHGVIVETGVHISAGGTGSVHVWGQGGFAESTNNYGVYLRDSGSMITSSGGPVTVTGLGGGTDAASFGVGVVVQSSGGISSGGTGNVTVQGTGGAGTGGFNWGVLVQNENSHIASDGIVSVKGTGGAGDSNFGICLLGTATVTCGGPYLSLNSDSINVGLDSSVGASSVIIQTLSEGTRIDLGGADVLTGTPRTLGLSDDELDRINAVTLQIGQSGAMGSGDISDPPQNQ